MERSLSLLPFSSLLSSPPPLSLVVVCVLEDEKNRNNKYTEVGLFCLARGPLTLNYICAFCSIGYANLTLLFLHTRWWKKERKKSEQTKKISRHTFQQARSHTAKGSDLR